MKEIRWQYCKNLNDINRAMFMKDDNWEGLLSAEQIVSITFVTSHMCYVVFWTVTGEE